MDDLGCEKIIILCNDTTRERYTQSIRTPSSGSVHGRWFRGIWGSPVRLSWHSRSVLSLLHLSGVPKTDGIQSVALTFAIWALAVYSLNAPRSIKSALSSPSPGPTTMPLWVRAEFWVSQDGVSPVSRPGLTQ